MASWNDYGISNWTVLLISTIVLFWLSQLDNSMETLLSIVNDAGTSIVAEYLQKHVKLVVIVAVDYHLMATEISCIFVNTAQTSKHLRYTDRKFCYWERRGVKSLTFWGCWRQIIDIFRKPVVENMLQNYKKFGRIYGTYMGFTPQLSVADPTLLKQILVKDFHMFHNRVKFTMGEPMFDNLLTVMQDDDWKRVRCIISPTFTSSRMRKMAYLVKECAEKFAKHCEKTAENNEEINCKKYYSGFSIDIIASTAFGTKINALEDPNHPFVKNATKFSNEAFPVFLALFFFFPKIMKLTGVTRLYGVTTKYFKRFATHVIEEREKNNIKANDFLQLMLDAQRGKLEQTEEDLKEGKEEHHIQNLPDHKTMSFDELLTQCILFFGAGGETTSITLSFISYYMALHPEYQERLIDEIDKVWQNHDEITYDVLNKMTYLDAVICEVLRLQPVAIQLFRLANEDCTLGDTGIKLEKDVSIIVPVYAMHHDPEFFPDPEKFDPERFMPENRQSIPPYVYLPFGDGPRNCIGMRFAIMVLKLCVVYLFRTVRLEATKNTKKPLEYGKGQGFLHPKEVMVRMMKRNNVVSRG